MAFGGAVTETICRAGTYRSKLFDILFSGCKVERCRYQHLFVQKMPPTYYG